ncbi:Phox homologous domain-containing protein [Phlyctochytrium arcticum]|nr:Phox homologous domain-containing protein [Phlyctochytrium arcticum]
MSRPTSISIPSPTSPKLQNVVTPPAAAEDTPKSTPILGGRPRTRSKSNTLINKPVKRAVVTEVIKPQSAGSRASAGKDYVYLIDVYHVGVPEEQPPMTIRQTYDDFFDFHMQLIGHFPEEGGVRAGLTKQNSEGVNSMPGGWSEAPKRIIPELPGQMMFVSEAAAQGRVALLHDYIQAILALPPKISRSPVTMNFFRMDGKHVLSLGES